MDNQTGSTHNNNRGDIKEKALKLALKSIWQG